MRTPQGNQLQRRRYHDLSGNFPLFLNPVCERLTCQSPRRHEPSLKVNLVFEEYHITYRTGYLYTLFLPDLAEIGSFPASLEETARR